MGVRAGMLAEPTVEARGLDVFFENAAKQKGLSPGLSLRVKKPIFQVKLELQAEVQRGVGLLMAEAQPEIGPSQNLVAVKAIPVPPRKHLLLVVLLTTPIRSKWPFRPPSKRQEFW